MLKRILSIFSSMRLASVLLLCFAFSIGYATFVERDFGTASANALIYRAWWFEYLLVFLSICLFLNIFKYKLYRKDKIPTFTFHIAFIVIIIGAGITRFIGFEGMMQIYEGETENTFMSDNVYLQTVVADTNEQVAVSIDKQLNLSGITKRFDNTFLLKHLFSNYFSIDNKSLKKRFSISYVDFLPNVAEKAVDSIVSGVRMATSSNTEKQGTELSQADFSYSDILIDSSLKIKGIKFTVNNMQDSAVNFFVNNNLVQCVSSYDLSLINMMTRQQSGIYAAGTVFDIQPMTLISVNGFKFNLVEFLMMKTYESYSSSNNMNFRDNPYRKKDELVLMVKAGNKQKEIKLRGKKSDPPDFLEFELDGLFFKMAYGPKYYELPFSVRLDSAQTVYYPGSGNPESYKSHVSIFSRENNTLKKMFSDSIYMNNILNYKGYRFYQASIAEDDSWTGLSVNNDAIGTIVSYLGYAMMMLGMILIFFFRNTRFKFLTKQFNKFKKTSLIICFSFLSVNSIASNNYLDSLSKYEIKKEFAKQFDQLLIQHDGRIKPMSTYSLDIIRKLSRKTNLYKQDPSQIVLGIMSYPKQWAHIPLFKIKNQLIIDDLNKLETNKEIISEILNDYKINVTSVYSLVQSEITIYEIVLKSNEEILKIKQLEESILASFSNKNIKILFFEDEVDKIIFEVTNKRDKNKKTINYDFSALKLPKITNQKTIDKNEKFHQNKLVSFLSLNSIITRERAANIFEKIEVERSKKEKEILRLYSGTNIFLSLATYNTFFPEQTGMSRILTIFPVKDQQKWSPLMQLDSISGMKEELSKILFAKKDSLLVHNRLSSYPDYIQAMFKDFIKNEKINIFPLFNYHLKLCNDGGDCDIALDLLTYFKKYQRDKGDDLIPPKWKLDLEILYNKVDIFHQLFILYFFTGFLSLILVIIQMFYNQRWLSNTIKLLKFLIFSALFLHTLGLASRWVISNHAPWTNGYEAMIYTVWATMLAGVIFSKRSSLTLATTTLVSSLLLLFAFISSLDPTITNVVPVLNSYWLMIHVSIIVASYGFLIMGGFLGLLCLFLIIFNKKNREIINHKITELTIINEKSLTIGLFMLSIGTFLGGIWANESWGRYWGWDAKETWALVSILVYAIILHFRFIPGLKSKFVFNFASIIAVFSVLMTYFGVNYLLSGLHSYAAADEKVTIPSYIYLTFISILVIGLIAGFKNKRRTLS